MSPRKYEETHQWITFTYRTEVEATSARLGEAFSKCQHLSGTPLPPGMADYLAGVYLIKGAVATTAIEGNTLTVNDVQEIKESGRKLPPSQQYLQQEIDNVLDALENVRARAAKGDLLELTPEWIKECHAAILKDLEHEDHVVPGEYRTDSVLVGSVYRGAPYQDIPYLMDRLCSWLNTYTEKLRDPDLDDDSRFFLAFYAAVLAHIYIAWIHPFGDGNGRTARMLECALLAHSGVVPWVSCNLLSDHYNRTRTMYYRKLDAASKRNEVKGFIEYSAQGFVDMLREQINDVQEMQRHISWVNFIHQQFRNEPSGKTQHRRRTLALALPDDETTSRREIRRLTAELAEMYAGKEDKTISRDLTKLEELKLIRRVTGGYRARIEIMDAFLPVPSKYRRH